jgi:hypothetical protein
MSLIDFSKLGLGGDQEAVIEPRQLFTTLQKNERFRFPSDHQTEVLSQWYARRDQRDITLKMNTGSGKTLVGLLLLKSSLNEGKGPAVYVSPDPYLSTQVVNEAKDLGIDITTDERSPEFTSHSAVLSTTIKTLFNGRSTFGVGRTKIKIGSIVIDDAHACLSKMDEQFMIRVERGTPIYKRLLGLFKESISQQSIVGALQVDNGDPAAYVPVPFWAWRSHVVEVAKVLIEHKDNEELMFSLPLLADCLELCQCVIGGTALEIAPRCVPVDVIPAFNSAIRRVYMTATLADDGVLVTHFDADPTLIWPPVKPKGVGDMGDRMILIPQKINPACTDDDLRKLVTQTADTYNSIVIVPSNKRASYWKPVAKQILNAKTIEAGVVELRNKHVGLSILINKYDGIDLPDEACRLLVVDGLPEAYGLIERVEFSVLDGTELQLVRQVQRIEQGMGRGVRSSNDFCVVILTGRRLIERLNMPAARQRFSAATQAQIAVAEDVAKQLKGKPITALREVMDLCFSRNQGWVAAGRRALANAPENGGFIDPTVTPKRVAFNAARASRWDLAKTAMETAANSTNDPATKGYLMQQLAEYVQNPAEAQEILLSALKYNNRIMKPIKGVTYTKLTPPAIEQAGQCVAFTERFANSNDLVIWGSSLVEGLNWDPDATERFEASLKELGLFLGFGSQRPEQELGKGPDNLWALGGLKYLVIECKSGATVPEISKGYSNQLIGSMQWFASAYDQTCVATPIMIHPAYTFDVHANPNPETKIIDEERLTLLRQRLGKLMEGLAEGVTRQQPQKVGSLLKEHGFTAADFVSTFTRMYAMAKRVKSQK